MAKKTKKSDGPSCACGKVDLYEEVVKLNKNKKVEGTDPIGSSSVDDKK